MRILLLPDVEYLDTDVPTTSGYTATQDHHISTKKTTPTAQATKTSNSTTTGGTRQSKVAKPSTTYDSLLEIERERLHVDKERLEIEKKQLTMMTKLVSLVENI